ncbi:hypothetical protein RI367_000520 [Sorochytrium milnesiophthora]
MRFNESDVAYFARSPSAVQKTGYLSKQGEGAFAQSQRRWFVLKGNLLFYFRAHDGMDPPIGFILLEHHVVTKVAQPAHGISISFLAPESKRQYVLVAADEREQNMWYQLLSEAGMERMVRKLSTAVPQQDLQLLQSDVRQLSLSSKPATDSKQRAKEALVLCAVSVHLSKEYVAQHQSVLANAGVMCRMVAVREDNVIETVGQQYPVPLLDDGVATFLVPYCVPLSAMALSIEVSAVRTQRSSSLLGMKTFQRPTTGGGWFAQTLMQSLHDVEGTPMGSLVVTVRPFVERPALSLFTDMALPPLRLTARYVVPTLTLIETATESPYAFLVPLLLLRAYMAEEQRVLTMLDSVRADTDDVALVRLRQQDIHRQLLQHYSGQASILEQRIQRQRSQEGWSETGTLGLLRKSIEKNEEEVQWVALNCVLQQLHICPGDGDGADATSYTNVTFGAPAAHMLGFQRPAGQAQDVSDTARLVAYQAYSAATQLRGELGQHYTACMGAAKALQQSINSVAFEADPQQGVADLQRHAQVMDRACHEICALGFAAMDAVSHTVFGSTLAYVEQVQHDGRTVLEEHVPRFAVRMQQLALAIQLSSPSTAQDKVSYTAQMEALVMPLEQLVQLTAKFYQRVHSLLDHYALLLDSQFSARSDWQVSRKREDVLVSQCLGAMVTGFADNLQQWTQHVDRLRTRHALASDADDDDAELPQRNELTDIFWHQLMHVGWLAQFESLLSTQGDEAGMLQDMQYAIRHVSSVVKFAVHNTAADGDKDDDDAPLLGLFAPLARYLRISGDRRELVVSFGLAPTYYRLLPLPLQHGRQVSIVGVLFSQGINEQQTMANVLGNTALQEQINQTSMRTLQDFAERFRDWMIGSNALPVATPEQREFLGGYLGYLWRLLEQLQLLVQGGAANGSALAGDKQGTAGGSGAASTWTKWFTGTKNTDILVVASQVTKVVGSVCHTLAGSQQQHQQLSSGLAFPAFGSHPSTTMRFTSCKSAKDRTSMSVTLEQCLTVQQLYEAEGGNRADAAKTFEGLLDAMRGHAGVRLQHIARNLHWQDRAALRHFLDDNPNEQPHDQGKDSSTMEARYAFNQMQWNALPKLYRPPLHTIRSSVAS